MKGLGTHPIDFALTASRWPRQGITIARVSDGALLEPAHVASAGASDAALLTVGDGSIELFGRAGGDLVRARAVCAARPRI